MMKKIILNIFLISLIVPFTYGQDVTVSSGDIIKNQSGSISPGFINFTVNENYSPITIVASGPCEGTIIGNTFSIVTSDPSCAGIYCFSIFSDSNNTPEDRSDDCVMEFCEEIKYCEVRVDGFPYNSVSIYCLHRPNFPDDSESSSIYIESNLNDDFSKSNGYDIYSNLDFTEFESNSQSILEMTSQYIDIVLENGSSLYDIESQTEFKTDADFLFKYDIDGNLIWIYHTITPQENRELSTNLKSITELSVYPNPFQNKIAIEFIIQDNQKVKITLINSLGELMESRTFATSNGNNKIEFPINEQLASGFYFLELKDANGNMNIHKLIRL